MGLYVNPDILIFRLMLVTGLPLFRFFNRKTKWLTSDAGYYLKLSASQSAIPEQEYSASEITTASITKSVYSNDGNKPDFLTTGPKRSFGDSLSLRQRGLLRSFSVFCVLQLKESVRGKVASYPPAANPLKAFHYLVHFPAFLPFYEPQKHPDQLRSASRVLRSELAQVYGPSI